MASTTDVFYGFCTFWTGDWAWLRQMNGALPPRPPEPDRWIERPDGRRMRSVAQPVIPHCPFCGSVGFETPRETWLRQAREWEDGTSPKAPGVRHPGYVAMIMWGEKKCFPNSAALEAAWRSAQQTPEPPAC